VPWLSKTRRVDNFEDSNITKLVNLNDFSSFTKVTKNSWATLFVPKFLEKLNDLKEKLKEASGKAHDYQCEINRFNKLVYNCGLRRNEGYMINKSLADLRKDIQSLIKNSLKLRDDKPFLPIFYEKDVFPYCRNTIIDDRTNFDYFYDFEDPVDKSTGTINNLSGILMDIMQTKPNVDNILGFGLDFTKINFVVFTVINTSNNGKVNNPPNPPYINLNDLTYTKDVYNDKDYRDKLLKKLKAIFMELTKYSFYATNSKINELKASVIDENYNDKGKTTEIIKNVTKLVIDIINGNNPSTLIGSLEATDMLQNTVYNKFVCSHTESLDNIVDNESGMKLNVWENDKVNDIYDLDDIMDDDKNSFDKYK
jgi:hypothetical protein